jgi:hypothetical protein
MIPNFLADSQICLRGIDSSFRRFRKTPMHNATFGARWLHGMQYLQPDRLRPSLLQLAIAKERLLVLFAFRNILPSISSRISCISFDPGGAP